MLFFVALSCLAAATLGSVVVYQRGERRRLDGGRAPGRLPAGPAGGRPSSSSPPSVSSASPSSGSPASGTPAWIRAQAGTHETDAFDEPTLTTLAPGDVVSDGVDDWVIAGSVRYREENDGWSLHVLDGGGSRRFLEVRSRRGSVEVALLDVADALPRGQLLGGLTYRGQSYLLDARGDARTAADGDVGVHAARGPSLTWARYTSAGGGLLIVEDEATIRRGYVGSRVEPSSLSILSGELNRAAMGPDADAGAR